MKLFQTFSSVTEVGAGEARKRLDEAGPEALGLLDVREPVEYEMGHIPGALNIPLSTLADAATGLDKSKPMITY